MPWPDRRVYVAAVLALAGVTVPLHLGVLIAIAGGTLVAVATTERAR